MLDKRVHLEKYELMMAAHVGVARQVNSCISGVENSVGNKDYSYRNCVEGAAAELVLAKYLGIYWDGSVDTFKGKPDVGQFEVRQTKYHNGRLVLQENDSRDSTYVLVTGDCQDYIVQGWLPGRVAFGVATFGTLHSGTKHKSYNIEQGFLWELPRPAQPLLDIDEKLWRYHKGGSEYSLKLVGTHLNLDG